MSALQIIGFFFSHLVAILLGIVLHANAHVLPKLKAWGSQNMTAVLIIVAFTFIVGILLTFLAARGRS